MVAFSWFLVSCGEKKPPEQLRIMILNSENELKSDVFNSLVKAYTNAHPKIVVSCTPESISSEIPPHELAVKFGGTDVVIFPSIFNQSLKSLPNAFYPVSEPETQLPPVLGQAFAASESGKLWASPLMMDPMVMILKKTLNPPNLTWQMLEIYGNIARKNQGTDTPPMTLLNGRPADLADSVASRMLSMGFQKYLLHNLPLEMDTTQKDVIYTLGNGFRNWKRFLNRTPKDRLSELPLVSDLNDFIDSPSSMIFARYSDFQSLPPDRQNKLRAIQIPTPYRPTTLVRVVSAGIPIESGNPTRGEEFINYLLSEQKTLYDKHGFIPTNILEGNDKIARIFSRKTVFVPRERHAALGQKLIIDSINGKMSIEEFNTVWASAIFFPSQ